MREILAKGVPIRNLRIRNRKDWVIFWAFAVIVAYIAAGSLSRRVNVWLVGIETPWMTNLNEPQNYGRTIVAAILLTALVECVLFLCRKPVWARAAALAAGILLSLAIVGIYQVHCRLIVSVLWKEEPGHVGIVKDGQRRWDHEISEQEREEILELCRSLEIITDSGEVAKCMQWYDPGEDFMGVDSIELNFSEKYGHSYSFQLRIKEGHVYLWRGYQGRKTLITFYEDNGIIEWMESRGSAAPEQP